MGGLFSNVGTAGRVPTRGIVLAVLWVVVIIRSATLSSGQVVFDLAVVANRNTPIPGGSGNFIDFGGFPSLDGGNVAFTAGDLSEHRGIYLFDGGLSVVADTNTPIPGAIGNFEWNFFGAPSLDGGSVAFAGGGFSQRGIYLFNFNGGGSVFADTTTPIPAGFGNFNDFGNPSLDADAGRVAFVGSGFIQNGVYLFNVNGGGTVVADGSGNFAGFGNPSLDAGSVAFRAGGMDSRGIYRFNGGGGSAVADTNTPVPGGSGNFRDFGDPSLDGGSVAFVGYFPPAGYSGVYLSDGGLSVVADANTPIPGGSGNFGTFGQIPSLDGGSVAFAGQNADNSQAGIYLFNGGGSVVADRNTPIPGGSGNIIHFGNPSLDGGNVAFWGIPSDDLDGIYVAFQAHRWNRSSSGSWDSQSNWLFGAVPRNIVPTILDNDANVTITGPTSDTTVRSLQIGGGTGTVTLALQPGGSITATTGVDIRATGVLAGHGTIHGNVLNRSSVAPGSSVGSIEINGDYTQDNAGRLVIELATASNYDRLTVSGHAALDGTLEMRLIDGFAPQVGHTFDILDWDSLSGTFDLLLLPTLNAGRMWNASQLYTAGILSVQLVGDYNGNGIVDAADYTVWRDSLGRTGTGLAADGNGNNMIDAGDYGIWTTYFGAHAGGGASANAVPESGALVLLTIGLLTLLPSSRALRRRGWPIIIADMGRPLCYGRAKERSEV